MAPLLTGDIEALGRVTVALRPVTTTVDDAWDRLDAEITISIRGIARQNGTGTIGVDPIIAVGISNVALDRVSRGIGTDEDAV
jgi:hypothetical protein